ncbi:hypothetical protein QJS10_CPA05g00793 [Acorus calamus]|uniref:Protein SirB1 N-terminal domain-containing protein n=1 Tax=Acorus calamus TaxID=4465 RepID=A0AAV9EUS6_ACOCL|nr:hypothetical protein QJS10_CPA05g00793 [Acorus calamus]
MNGSDTRALYLHSVLTCRSGSVAMLSLIYSEILKMLRLWGLLNFDAEIYFPHDSISLPRGYIKQKSKQSDQQHIMTAQTHLVEMLRNLKDAFWPFQYDQSSSLFLRAAHAANNVGGLCITDEGSSNSCNSVSGLDFASAKAAQHRLGRGVWTSVRYGDMRRALAACERLILLDSDPRELRDYSVLLYHLGYYRESLQYLNLYQNSKSFSLQKESTSISIEKMEEEALDQLIIRLNLLLTEESWGEPNAGRKNWVTILNHGRFIT